jgi:hypothetical protein
MNRTSLSCISLVALLSGVACAGHPDVDQVPIGKEVEVTKDDGGVVKGKLTERDATSVKVTVGQATKSVPRAQIANVHVVDATKPAPPPPAMAKFREYTIPAGTKLSVRLTTPASSATSKVEDAVEGELTDAVTIDGAEVLPAGSVLRGDVSAAQPSGKVKGLASLAVRFRTITAAGRGDRYDITGGFSREAETTKGEDAKKIGIGAGAGAVLGAIIGGKKGAAVGTAVGGGAGTAAVLSTSGKEVTFDRGAVVTVTLEKDIDVRVPIK